jgi:hypothetical protein
MPDLAGARDNWTDAVERGGLPKIPSRPALPSPGPHFAYRLVVIRGTPDNVYCCTRNGSGSWTWTKLG